VQESGNFCGKCGNALTVNTDETPIQQQHDEIPIAKASHPQEETNPNFDKVKDSSTQYFAYFKKHLKNPSAIFTSISGNTLNGVVSWLIFIGMIGIIAYAAIDVFIQFIILQDLDFDEVLPTNYFMTIFTRGALFTAIITGTIIFILFGLINLFIRPVTFKWVTQMYGTVLIPAILMSAATWLLILLGSYTVATVTFSLTLSMVLLVLPLIVLYQTARDTEPKIDRVHIGLIYLGAYTLASYILYFIILESTIVKLTKYAQEFMYYF